MSVNMKVTVPVGGLLTLSSLPLLPQGHYNSRGYYRPFLLLPLFTVVPRSPISPKFAEHEEGRGPKKPPPLGRRTRRSPPSSLVLNEHYGVLCDIRVVSKSPSNGRGTYSIRSIRPTYRKIREPTSGLEPLYGSLRVIINVLQGFAQGCNTRISKGVSFPCLAPRCTILRSRWYQSGIKRLPVIRVEWCRKSLGRLQDRL